MPWYYHIVEAGDDRYYLSSNKPGNDSKILEFDYAGGIRPEMPTGAITYDQLVEWLKGTTNNLHSLGLKQ